MSSKFENYLNTHNEAAWLETVESLAADIHEVDRNAVRIWFRFFPLELFRYLESAEDLEATVKRLAIQGNYRVKDQIDTSHHFVYGHRFWPEVKSAIIAENERFDGSEPTLGDVITNIARVVSERSKAPVSLTLGISAIGLMTLVQSGLEAFKSSPGTVKKPSGLMASSPDKIVRERAKDSSQGLFGFLKTIDKTFRVNYKTPSFTGDFEIIKDEEITSASAKDRSRDWQSADHRCWEGVVPVECKSAACGTCWVGVLGGTEKLTEVERLEHNATELFGYNQPEGDKPYLRLACQSRAHGDVTIVVPPWNGVFGREVYGVDHIELEPATTSAKKNRTIVKDAVKNQLM